MRRKYFIRGMGVGIVVTALVFTIALFVTGDTMSNKEIIAAAEKLGMVMPDSTTMSNTETETKDSEKTDEKDAETTTDSTGATVTVENKTGDEVTKAPEETTDPTTENNKKKEQTKTETKIEPSSSSENIINFTIRQGENSSIVSANLYKAGLVKNPSDYDQFLESNGYDKYLNPGTYNIREGSTEESIAKTLTGR